MEKTVLFLFCISAGFCFSGYSQDSLNQNYTLDQCIDYAMQHQPLVKQSQIGISMARANNMVNLSGWYPQVTGTAIYTYYIQLPTSILNENGQQLPVKTGIANTLIPGIAATQNIFSPSLVYAATSSKLLLKEARQVNDSAKIDIIWAVSKSFYNLLLTLQQINVFKEDTALLDKNLSDTYHQYIGGIVDKTDYEEATITLNNTKAQLKQALENVQPQYAALKQVMGLPPMQQFNIAYDTMQMMQQIVFDTTAQLQFQNRIEYQQLQTAMQVQHKFTNYNWLNFLPTVSAFYYYNYEWENNTVADLVKQAYPNSYVGLSLNWPLFTGLRRIESVRLSKLQEQYLNWSEEALKSEIYTEYTSALASYKGNLYDYYIMRDNVKLAREVYGIVTMQYRQGVVPYLNVITAESNLISSEITELNALFTVLSSKADLEKSMGAISPNR